LAYSQNKGRSDSRVTVQVNSGRITGSETYICRSTVVPQQINNSLHLINISFNQVNDSRTIGQSWHTVSQEQAKTGTWQASMRSTADMQQVNGRLAVSGQNR
jgi:hypothetical protein